MTFELDLQTWIGVAAGAGAVVVAGFLGAHLWVWTALAVGGLFAVGCPPWGLGLFGAAAAIFNIRPLRRLCVSRPLLGIVRALKLAPQVSETERAALEAGAVWVEREFFTGRPNFRRLLSEPYPELTAEEQAYVEGPVEELCRGLDDWKIYQDREMPPEVWARMRKMGIFGMIIPKKFGGLGFSPLAHSEVIHKLASRSIPATITAMVPNSLGPAELLLHYGTEEQKNHYLPKLASGEMIPCFALTEQRAGSDAGSLESNGELYRKADGSVWIRLSWNKRWITLAGVADLVGLAFELRDPNHVLGDEYIVGITCALIPATTPGVVRGERHDPLGVPFHNCPIQGRAVEIPADWIIGGLRNAGRGWAMLMDCLGAGRGISLPAQATGGAKVVTRVVSAHTSIRRQFGLPLCKLEGLEEPLARIGAYTYALEAMRRYTAGALGQDIKPSVVSAIMKQSATELMRTVVNDGMDIMAGAGISRGPRNVIAPMYQALPIGITVEGANILTRTMIIFGQGLFRAHPWAFRVMKGIDGGDAVEFDLALWGHIHHVVTNVFRVVVHGLTRGRLARTGVSGPLGRLAQKLSWASACFALLADVAGATLGGGLKRREKLTGRYADVLSWQYVAASVLRRYHAEGRQPEDLPLALYCLRHALGQIQAAFEGILANFPVPVLGKIFRWIARPLARLNALDPGPSDSLGHRAAAAILEVGGARDRVTAGIHLPQAHDEALGRLEYAFTVCKRAEAVENRISRAVRQRLLPKKRIFKLIEPAREQGIISEDEARLLNEAATVRWEACQVDAFTEAAYHGVEPEASVPVEEGGNKRFRDDYVGPAGAPGAYPGPTVVPLKKAG